MYTALLGPRVFRCTTARMRDYSAYFTTIQFRNMHLAWMMATFKWSVARMRRWSWYTKTDIEKQDKYLTCARQIRFSVLYQWTYMGQRHQIEIRTKVQSGQLIDLHILECHIMMQWSVPKTCFVRGNVQNITGIVRSQWLRIYGCRKTQQLAHAGPNNFRLV